MPGVKLGWMRNYKAFLRTHLTGFVGGLAGVIDKLQWDGRQRVKINNARGAAVSLVSSVPAGDANRHGAGINLHTAQPAELHVYTQSVKEKEVFTKTHCSLRENDFISSGSFSWSSEG